jgi:S-(hydroxymethyl)glutathione dehydrogenase/alcohol dehydrogenase
MKAVTFQGKKNIELKNVEDPKIVKNDDIIVKITSTSICGSDLHIYQGTIPTPHGYVIGHEAMGMVEQVGPEVTKVKKGDRVVIPFTVSCGNCFYCMNEMESQCDNSNPHPHPYVDSGGYFGYTERYGNYPGAQAELLRVPYGNFMPFVIPPSCELEDESLLFLADLLPTAYWSIENSGMKPGDTVVVLGCGPVGLMTQKFAWMKGAKRVIAIDHLNYRLNYAKKLNNVETFNLDDFKDVGSVIKEITNGGAEIIIDCVGMNGKKSALEVVEQSLKLQGGTLSAIQIALKAVRKFGTIQLTGLYGAYYNIFPLGEMFERNISLKMGVAPVRHYIPFLYHQIAKGEFDPAQVITHILPLDDAKYAYNIFHSKEDDCIKVVLKT